MLHTIENGRVIAHSKAAHGSHGRAVLIGHSVKGHPGLFTLESNGLHDASPCVSFQHGRIRVAGPSGPVAPAQGAGFDLVVVITAELEECQFLELAILECLELYFEVAAGCRVAAWQVAVDAHAHGTVFE